MPTVRSACSDDLTEAGRSLSAAFEDDPVWQWLVPRSRGWQKRQATFFARECELAVRRGAEVWVDDDVRGVAVWAPPDRWRSSPSETVRLAPAAAAVFRTRLVRVLRTERRNEQHHPVDPPHWYLAYLGTHPDHQGRGIGSALTAAVTRRCDDEALPSYLESSKEENLAFYRRHGFEVTGRFDTAGGGPPLWTMWREPQLGAQW